MPNLIWNYEDVDKNLLSVYQGKQCMGYFKIDRNEFVIMTDLSERIHIDFLRMIVNGYDDALKEAKKMIV